MDLNNGVVCAAGEGEEGVRDGLMEEVSRWRRVDGGWMEERWKGRVLEAS